MWALSSVRTSPRNPATIPTVVIEQFATSTCRKISGRVSSAQAMAAWSSESLMSLGNCAASAWNVVIDAESEPELEYRASLLEVVEQ